MFFMGVLAGDRPPRYGLQGRLPFTVGRGPVPRRASIGTGNGFGRRAFFAQVERSRGTGPRATGQEGFSSCAVRDQVLPNYRLFKVRRTLMSIAHAARQVLKVR